MNKKILLLLLIMLTLTLGGCVRRYDKQLSTEKIPSLQEYMQAILKILKTSRQRDEKVRDLITVVAL